MHRRGKLLPAAVAALFAVSGLAVPPAAVANESAPNPQGRPPDVVRIGVFGTNAAMTAAIRKGFFAAQNVDLRVFQVSGSIQQFQFLRDDQYDLVSTASDNCANYATNQNNPLGAIVDVKMIAGVDHGAGLSLVTRAPFTSVESLRGARLSVDAPDSGFAFVLYKMMAAHGLQRNVDYQVLELGGSAGRFNSLRAGTSDGTLELSGFEIRAVDAGMNRLDHVRTVADPYWSGVFAGKQSWLQQNKWVAVRFLRAYLEGVAWVNDPANRAEAISFLVNATTPEPLAARLFDAQLLPDGIIPGAAFDEAGLREVLELREEFGGFEQPQDLESLSKTDGPLTDSWYLKHALQAP